MSPRHVSTAARRQTTPSPVRITLPRAAFVAMLAAELALVLVPRHFVTGDGPFHVGVAALFRDFAEGHTGLVDHYYQWRSFPVPNLLADVGLAALLTVFGSALAEKLLLATYVLSLPLALLYAVRGICPRNTWLVFLAFPLTFTFALNFGFYDFSFSVVAFLIVAGYTWRHRSHLSWRHATVLCALLFLAFFTHAVGYLESLLFVVLVLGTEWFRTGRDHRALRLGSLALVITPSLVLFGWFMVTTSTGVPSSLWAGEPRYEVLIDVLTLSWGITSYSGYETIATAALALVVAGLVISIIVREPVRLRQLARDGLVLFTIVGAVATVAAPFSVQSGGSFISQRLALFPAYGAILWIANHRVPRLLAVSTVVTACLVACALAAIRLPTYQKLDRVMTDYLSVEPCLATGSTMVQANFGTVLPDRDNRVDPFSDTTGVLAADLRGIDVGTSQGSLPYFQLRYRPAVDPNTYLLRPNSSGIASTPPSLDPLGYERHTGGRVDYILLFGRNQHDPAELADPIWKRFSRELHSGYRLAAISPLGWVQAWVRRRSNAAARGRARSLRSHASACRPAARGR